MMFYMTGIKPIMTWFITKFYNSNFIDFVSLMCIMTMGSIIPNLGLPFSRHLTYVANDIFLSPNLQLPNHWKKFVLSLLFYVTSVQSFTYIHVTNSNIDDDEDIDYSWWIAANIIQITVNNYFVFIFFFLALWFIDEFKRNVCLPKNNIIMAILYCITLTAEEAYDALQSLNKPLEKILVNENNFAQREHIKATIRKLEKIRPLNGNGYFNITRETLTSTVSTTVTYLIILLQFR